MGAAFSSEALVGGVVLGTSSAAGPAVLVDLALMGGWPRCLLRTAGAAFFGTVSGAIRWDGGGRCGCLGHLPKPIALVHCFRGARRHHYWGLLLRALLRAGIRHHISSFETQRARFARES